MCSTERVVLGLGLDSREASLLSCCRVTCCTKQPRQRAGGSRSCWVPTHLPHLTTCWLVHQMGVPWLARVARLSSGSRHCHSMVAVVEEEEEEEAARAVVWCVQGTTRSQGRRPSVQLQRSEPW